MSQKSTDIRIYRTYRQTASGGEKREKGRRGQPEKL